MGFASQVETWDLLAETVHIGYHATNVPSFDVFVAFLTSRFPVFKLRHFIFNNLLTD